MDDRVEMTYKMCISKEHDGIGLTMKMARDALSDLVALGAITASRSGNGVLVSAVNYCNCSGQTKGKLRANLKTNFRANLDKPDVIDIFGNIADEPQPKGEVEGEVEGTHFDQSRANLGGVLYRGDKREKNINSEDMLTPVIVTPQQAESSPKKRKRVSKPKEPSKSKGLREAYSQEFSAAYNIPAPKWGVKEWAPAQSLISELGEETAIEMIRKYFKTDDNHAKKVGHAFTYFIFTKNRYYVEANKIPKKFEYTTFVKDFKPCADAATKIRESYNNEKG
ncbi:MAG: hypothetical protein KJ630_05220 [Proteobacteria bacterium]|nr:hypothetical protein [Pseudomonadota bacterium]